jgi:hypothetical protein
MTDVDIQAYLAAAIQEYAQGKGQADNCGQIEVHPAHIHATILCCQRPVDDYPVGI